MKKIGIVTIYDNNNFGNRLQNYALCKYIEANGANATNIIYRKNPKSVVKEIFKNILNYKDERSKRKKRKYFDVLNSKMKFKAIMPKDRRKINDQFDAFIVGSDQVWNPYYGMNDLFMLKFSDNKKKNSYAASIGIDRIENDQLTILCEKLKDFNKVTVREETAKRILAQKGIKASVVVDPVLLLDRDEWKKIETKPKNYIDEKYILYYHLGNDSSKEIVSNYAKKHKLKIIDILNPRNKYFAIGPSEFIYLIDNASMVITDSFHAMVFSIIFGKKVKVVNRNDKEKNMSSRIKDLLSKYGQNGKNYLGEDIDVSTIRGNDIYYSRNLQDDIIKSKEILRKIIR